MPYNFTVTSPTSPDTPWALLELVKDETPITNDNKAQERIVLKGSKPSFTIGRVTGHDCTLLNPCISGVHCIFSYVMSSTSFNNNNASSAHSSQQDPHFSQTPAAVVGPLTADGTLVTLPCASQLPVRKVSIMDKSTNGVLVNGQLIGRDKSVMLQQGDIIDLVQVAHPRNAKYRMQYRLTVYQPTFCPVALAPETSADGNRNSKKTCHGKFVQDNGPASSSSDKKQVETPCGPPLTTVHPPQPAPQQQHAKISPPPQRNAEDRRLSLSPSASPSIRQPAGGAPKVACSAAVSSRAEDEDNSAPVNTGRSLFHSVPSAKTPAPLLAVGMAGVGATPPTRLPSLSQMGPNTQVIPAAPYTVYGGAGSASGLTSLLAEIKQAVAAGAVDAIASSNKGCTGSSATGNANLRNNNNSLLPAAPNVASSTNATPKPPCSSLLPEAPQVPVPCNADALLFGAGEKASINREIGSSGNSSNLVAVVSSSTSLSNVNNPAYETDDTILKRATPAQGARALSATPQTDGDATASPPLGQSYKGFVYASSASNHSNNNNSSSPSDNDNANEKDHQHHNNNNDQQLLNGGDGGNGPSTSSYASASTSASAAVAKMLAFISIGDDANNNVENTTNNNNKVHVAASEHVANANDAPLDEVVSGTRGLPTKQSSDVKTAVPPYDTDEKRKDDEASVTVGEGASDTKQGDKRGGKEKHEQEHDTSCVMDKPSSSSSTSPAKPNPASLLLPDSRKISDTTQQQSQAMTISVPPRSHKAKVDDVYVLMKNTPLGSGAFATVYKAYLRPLPSAKALLPTTTTATSGHDGGGEVDPDGFTKPSSRAANKNANQNHQNHSTVSVSLSSLPSVISQSQQPPPPPPAGPFFAIKVLDKTRLMGLSLKDEDAQYFNSLISKGPKQMARAIRGGVSPRRFMFAGGDTATKVAVGGGDPAVDEEAKKAAVEATNAEALRQLMAMDSSDDDDLDRDHNGGDGENESDVDELGAADGAPRNKKRRREDGVGGDTTDVIASGGSSSGSSPSTSQKANTVVGKKRARSPPTADRNKKASDTRPLASQNTIIRRRRVKAGEIEARHELFLGLLSEDMKARYERYLKEKLRWRREVMILRSVSHPNVIRTFDVFDTDTSLALVLELAEGGNLYSLITDGGSLPELIVKVIVYQLLKGVQHLHFHGIVHRDIKLENLLVGRPFTIGSFVAGSRLVEEDEVAARRRAGTGAAGGATHLLFSHGNKTSNQTTTATSPSRVLNTRAGGTDSNKPNDASIHEIYALPAVDLWPEVKITDFGLSRMLGEGTTTMQTMCGTPIYAAPEVTIAKLRADGAQSGYTAAVDIFSIGVVAFALLTARPPFPHPKDAYGRDVKGRIMYEKPLSWQRKSAYGNIAPISELGRQFVAAMLTLRPADRITADEALGHPWFADVRQIMP